MDIRTVGLYCSHTAGVGGGEHYAGSLMRALAARWPVDLLVEKAEWTPRQAVFDDLGVDLPDRNLTVRVIASPHLARNYDLFVNLSHFSVLPPWGRRNLLAVFFPQLFTEWAAQYDAVLTISPYSARWIENYWGVARTAVAAPPIDVNRFAPGPKEPLIVSVGRFFENERGNNKNQLLMVRAFRELLARGITGWRLALAGSTSEEHAGYLARVRAEAEGLPVDILTDVSADVRRDLYARASIYWHAAGFDGEGLTMEPAAAEHFGITIVEALASGAVPVVAAAGGPVDIVEPARHGLHAASVEEFIARTAWLARRPAEREALAAQGPARAREFSREAFEAEVHALIDAVAADDPLPRARYFRERGKLVAAEAELQHAVDRHPASADAHFELAECAYRLGRREMALAMWRRGAQIEPGHPAAARARALVGRIEHQRRHVHHVRSGALFGEAYFERGQDAGINAYTSYSGDSFAPVQADYVAATFAPSTCLEIGCAKGEFVRELRHRGVRAWGTDLSVYAVGASDAATRRHLTASAISALPYRDDAFDLVTAVEVFEHVPPEEVDRAIRELWRVARAFVWITVQNTTAATPEHFFTDLTHVTMKPLAWWQDRFRTNGFEVLAVELPFSQFHLHQIVAQPLGKLAGRSREDLLACGRRMLEEGRLAELQNFLDQLDAEQRPLPELREALRPAA
ncbi:MAG: methyltransferase domain-containing protein [Acidobacteriota bacterium]